MLRDKTAAEKMNSERRRARVREIEAAADARAAGRTKLIPAEAGRDGPIRAHRLSR